MVQLSKRAKIQEAVDARIQELIDGTEGVWRKQFEDAVQELKAAARKKSTSLATVVSDAWLLGSSATTWVEWRILNSIGHPWHDVDRCEAFAALWFNTVDPNDISGAYDISDALYSAIGSGNERRAKVLVEIGLARLNGGPEPWALDAERYPAAMFAIWLGAKSLGRTVEVPLHGSFADLAKHWEEPANLASIADYQGQLLVDNFGLEFVRFYSLLPIALVAIKTVRGAANLETIWPTEHPIVANMIARAYLSRPIADFDRKSDDIFPLVVHAIEKKHKGGLGFDPWTA